MFDDWDVLVGGALDCHCENAEERVESLVSVHERSQMSWFMASKSTFEVRLSLVLHRVGLLNGP